MVDVTGFRDIRFPSRISWGAQGGEAFQVTVQTTGSGYEYRNLDWDEARNEWDVSSNIRTQMEHDILVGFWRTSRGMAYSFRWKAWDDYRVSSETGKAEVSSNPLAFKLYKRYSDGTEFVDRRIVLPVDWTIHPANERVVEFKLFDGGVEVNAADYVMDWRNGVAWFDAPPGGAVTWQGEFDVPARFNMRKLVKTLVEVNYFNFDEVSIIEILPDEILEEDYISGGAPTP